MSAEVGTSPSSNGTIISPFAQKMHLASTPDFCDEKPRKVVLLNGHAGSRGDPSHGPPSVRTASASDSGPQQGGSTPGSTHQESGETPGSGPQQSGSTPGTAGSQQQQHRPRTAFRDLFYHSSVDTADGETTTSSSYTASGGIAAALRTAMRRTTGQNGSQDGNSAVKVFPNGDRYTGQWRDGQVCIPSLCTAAAAVQPDTFWPFNLARVTLPTQPEVSAASILGHFSLCNAAAR